jgi:predicted transcriptional regulator
MKNLVEKFVTSKHSFFYLKDEKGHITEKISQTELSSAAPDYENLKDFVVAQDISTPNRLIVNEKDHLDYVMKEFAKENIDEIPVVSDSDPAKVLGTIWRIDVISAYNKEILKRDLAGEVSHLMTAADDNKLVEIIEGLYLLEIEAPKSFIGKKIEELNLRNKYKVDVILIKKVGAEGGELLKKVPGGDYIFQPDDNLLVLGERKNVEVLSKL